jgi:hypothetical protein
MSGRLVNPGGRGEFLPARIDVTCRSQKGTVSLMLFLLETRTSCAGQFIASPQEARDLAALLLVAADAAEVG